MRAKSGQSDGSPFASWLWDWVKAKLNEDSQLTQVGLAQAMDVPSSSLSNWLNGKALPSRKSEIKLARSTGVPVAEIRELIARSSIEPTSTPAKGIEDVNLDDPELKVMFDEISRQTKEERESAKEAIRFVRRLRGW